MSIDKQVQPGGQAYFKQSHEKTDGRRLNLYSYDPTPAVFRRDGLDGAGPGAALRWHPLLKEWSIYAAHRQNRTFMPSAAQDPLAPTRPGGPLTEIETERFEVAVFQNRFASLHPEAVPPDAPPHTEIARANGDCEVVVYTEDAGGSLATLGQARRRLLVSAWIDRYADLHEAGAAFVMPFESRGREVGVTLDHPHGQIYAFPFVPQTQARMAKSFAEGYRLDRAAEDWAETYLVTEAGPLRALVPPFARYPFEVWIVPREPVRGPWAFGSEAFDAYAHLLGDLTRRYDAYFERPAATMMSLQAAPATAGDNFQFTTQFFSALRSPDRTKFFATVEHATAVFTVDVMPEAAAKALREVS